MTKKIPTEIYSRVCGYMRPMQQFNQAKQAEFHDRQNFDENISQNSKIPKLQTEQDFKENCKTPKPEITENGTDNKDNTYVGVFLCSACQDIKQKITAKEIEAKYLGFKNPKQAGEYLKSLKIELPKIIEFPLKITI